MVSNKTAGIIIIGNEILSGKVHDINSFYLAGELRGLGVDVRKITVIPDEVNVIGREVSSFSVQFDYVFTCGGVGPTHDDVTMEGIAKGFGVRLVRNETLRDVLQKRYKGELNPSAIKMTMIPDGAETILSENMRFPIVKIRNVYVFPGIPAYVRNKFNAIRERFRTSAYYLSKIYINSHETEIAGILNSVIDRNNGVIFGSYPVLDADDYRVIITAESKSDKALNKAVEELINLFPADIVVKKE